MQPIRSAMNHLAQQILAPLEEAERVQAAWPMAAGHAVAKRTRAVSFSAGALAVAVPDKAWQQTLIQLKPQLRMHLTRLTGVAVADILFFVETKQA